MTGAPTREDGTSAAVPSAMPPLYVKPVVLDAVRHAGKSLVPATGFTFARAVNSVAVNTIEFLSACTDYPLVFTSGLEPVPVAVLGVRDRQNLFVDAQGAWQSGSYIPAYVRRYPFIPVETQTAETMLLCVDEGTGLVQDSGERPLFANGQPTEIVNNAVAFCRAYQAEYQATREFCRALAERDLLTSNQAQVNLPDGERLMLGGFQIIDMNKFGALSDEVVLDWRRRGWLTLVYCHLASAGKWRALANMVGLRAVEAA